MKKAGGLKGGFKSVAKSGGSSPRRAYSSRPSSSGARNSWSGGGRSTGGGGRSWLSIAGPREPSRDELPAEFRRDGEDGSQVGGGLDFDLVQALGEGLAESLGDGFGEPGGRSAAVWRWVALGAAVIALVVLVVSAN